MGNCQANDAAVVVIQHPDGQAERLYWPTTADVIMRNHPDHYVAHITLSGDGRRPSEVAGGSSIGFTKIRLLKHKEMLLIGQVYRLMTSEEVTKELRARKQDKLRKAQNAQVKQQQVEIQQHFLQLLELQNQTVQGRTSTEDFADSGVADSQVMEQLTLRRHGMRGRSREVPGFGGHLWTASLRSEADEILLVVAEKSRGVMEGKIITLMGMDCGYINQRWLAEISFKEL